MYALALAATVAFTASSVLLAILFPEGPRPCAVLERGGAGLPSLALRERVLEERPLGAGFSMVNFSITGFSPEFFFASNGFRSGFSRSNFASPDFLSANLAPKNDFFSGDSANGFAAADPVRGRLPPDTLPVSAAVRRGLVAVDVPGAFPVVFAERFAAGGAEFFDAGLEAVVDNARATAREVFFETDLPSNVFLEGGLGPAAARPVRGLFVKGFADEVLGAAGAFLSKNFSSLEDLLLEDLLLEDALALRLGFVLVFVLGLVLRRDEGIERDCFIVSFQ